MAKANLHRLYWKPILPLCLLAYFGGRTYSAGLSTFRIFALSSIVLWLAIALYDRVSGGKFTSWLYRENRKSS